MQPHCGIGFAFRLYIIIAIHPIDLLHSDRTTLISMHFSKRHTEENDVK